MLQMVGRQNIFLVGCGALGCEFIKAIAMIGTDLLIEFIHPTVMIGTDLTRLVYRPRFFCKCWMRPTVTNLLLTKDWDSAYFVLGLGCDGGKVHITDMVYHHSHLQFRPISLYHCSLVKCLWDRTSLGLTISWTRHDLLFYAGYHRVIQSEPSVFIPPRAHWQDEESERGSSR